MKAQYFIKKVTFFLIVVLLSSAMPVFALFSEENKQSAYNFVSINDVPEPISIEQVVEKSHKTRLRGHEKDLYTAVFGNEDGTITEYVFSEPIKFIDENGVVKDKHISLEQTRGTYRNTADNDISFSAAQSLSQGASLSYGSTSLTIIPTFSENRSVSSEASNKTIVYSNMEDSIEFVVTPHINGVEFHVIIPESNASGQYVFELVASGLVPTQNSDGNITFGSLENDIVYMLTPATITDTDGRFAFCGESFTNSNRGGYCLTVDISSFTDNPNVHFPLDMTYSISTHDFSYMTFTSTNLYSFPNYAGTNAYMLLGHLDTMNNNNVYGVTNIKFADFTDAMYFYNDCNLVSATLNLYCYAHSLLSFMSVDVNGLLYYNNNQASYSNVVLNEDVDTVMVCGISANTYIGFDVSDYITYWRRNSNSNAAQNGWIISTFNYPGYYAYFTSPTGNSSQTPYMILTYSPRVNLNIPTNEYVIYNNSFNMAIKYYGSGSIIILATKDVTSALQRMNVELYSATDATYTIKNLQGNKYLTVNSSKQVYFDSAPANGLSDNQLWYIVQLSDGSVQFWSKLHSGHALYLIVGSLPTFAVTNEIYNANTKWRLQSYRIWYSQVSSQNSWDATYLNKVYFNGYDEYIMQDNSDDLMNTGCVMCSVAMVLRNIDKTTTGVDYRYDDWYSKELWADPFTVIMSNCLVDFSNNVVPDANGNIELTRGTGVGYPTSYIGDNIKDRFNVNIERIGYPTKNYIKNQLASHPEGICVHFVKNGKKHMIVVLDYDEDADNGNGDFIVCDPGTSNPTKGNKVYFKNSRTYTDKGMDFANAAFCLIFS